VRHASSSANENETSLTYPVISMFIHGVVPAGEWTFIRMPELAAVVSRLMRQLPSALRLITSPRVSNCPSLVGALGFRRHSRPPGLVA
jgi:hypothetical protein